NVSDALVGVWCMVGDTGAEVWGWWVAALYVVGRSRGVIEGDASRWVGLVCCRLALLILVESRLLVKLDRCDFEPLRPVPKTQSEFHLWPNKAFSVVAVCISNEMPRDP